MIQDILLSVISEIPQGQVTSYGTVAEIVSGLHDTMISGRTVGRLLTSYNPKIISQYPRWRVVNRHGYISSLKLGSKGQLQISLLEQEHIIITHGYIDMKQYGRKPRDRQ